MNHFPQLTPIENKLKQIYQQSLERSLQEPCDREDVMDVLLASYAITNDNNITKSLTTHIDEQTFILENMDISFVRHARYTPAFWHRHDFFEIIFVQNGTCTNYVLGRSIPMRTGDICISTTIQRETKLFLGADNEETAELTVPMYDFGDWASRMKAYRKKNHITQQELAQLMGVKHFTLRSWEQKQAKPPYNVWRLHKHLFDDSIKLT